MGIFDRLRRKKPDERIGRKKDASQHIQEGKSIGEDFEVRSVVDKNDFSVTYLAFDHSKDNLVAVKTLRDELMSFREAREQFYEGVKCWVSIGSHPHIASVVRVIDDSDRLYVVAEHVSPDEKNRVTLADHIAQARGGLALNLVIKWGIQFCRGMEHAYSKGLACHRNISPQSILIGSGTPLKITNFELANLEHYLNINEAKETMSGRGGGWINRSELEASLKMGGRVSWRFGTPEYMPSEQFETTIKDDVCSDIYSFGAVLYEMASGKQPFSLSRSVRRTQKHLEQHWNELRKLHQNAPVSMLDNELNPIVQKCLAKYPHERYPSFQSLRLALEHILREKFGSELEATYLEAPKSSESEALELIHTALELLTLGCYEEATAIYDKAVGKNANIADQFGGPFIKLKTASMLSGILGHANNELSWKEYLRLTGSGTTLNQLLVALVGQLWMVKMAYLSLSFDAFELGTSSFEPLRRWNRSLWNRCDDPKFFDALIGDLMKRDTPRKIEIAAREIKASCSTRDRKALPEIQSLLLALDRYFDRFKRSYPY